MASWAAEPSDSPPQGAGWWLSPENPPRPYVRVRQYRMLPWVALLLKYTQDSKALLSSSWQSQLSYPSKKKDALRRQIVLPGPSLYKRSMSESETYGLYFPGKMLSSSKANLAKGIGGGGGGFSTSRAHERVPEVLSSTAHPPSALGVLRSAHLEAQTLHRVKKTLRLRSFWQL